MLERIMQAACRGAATGMRWHGDLTKKRDFLIFSVVYVGIAIGAVLYWEFGRHAGIVFSIFCFALGLGGGLFWGVLMWKFFVQPRLPADKGGTKISK